MIPDKKQASPRTKVKAVETPPPPQHMDPSKKPVTAKKRKKVKRATKK